MQRERCAALLACLLLIAAPAAFCQDDGSVGALALTTETTFDIPGQSLDVALVAFARASGIDVLNDNNVTAGRETAGVKGVFAPLEALRHLLAGTGLKALFVNSRAVVIVAGPSHDTPAELDRSSAVLTLKTLEVHDVAPRIGGRNYERYAGAVRADIERYLRGMRGTSSPPFIAVAKLWIAADGSIPRVEWDRGSGDATIDRAIELQLRAAQVTPPPSVDMPQPLRFEIHRD